MCARQQSGMHVFWFFLSLAFWELPGPVFGLCVFKPFVPVRRLSFVDGSLCGLEMPSSLPHILLIAPEWVHAHNLVTPAIDCDLKKTLFGGHFTHFSSKFLVILPFCLLLPVLWSCEYLFNCSLPRSALFSTTP